MKELDLELPVIFWTIEKKKYELEDISRYSMEILDIFIQKPMFKLNLEKIFTWRNFSEQEIKNCEQEFYKISKYNLLFDEDSSFHSFQEVRASLSEQGLAIYKEGKILTDRFKIDYDEVYYDIAEERINADLKNCCYPINNSFFSEQKEYCDILLKTYSNKIPEYSSCIEENFFIQKFAKVPKVLYRTEKNALMLSKISSNWENGYQLTVLDKFQKIYARYNSAYNTYAIKKYNQTLPRINSYYHTSNNFVLFDELETQFLQKKNCIILTSKSYQQYFTKYQSKVFVLKKLEKQLNENIFCILFWENSFIEIKLKAEWVKNSNCKITGTEIYSTKDFWKINSLKEALEYCRLIKFCNNYEILYTKIEHEKNKNILLEVAYKNFPNNDIIKDLYYKYGKLYIAQTINNLYSFEELKQCREIQQKIGLPDNDFIQFILAENFFSNSRLFRNMYYLGEARILYAQLHCFKNLSALGFDNNYLIEKFNVINFNNNKNIENLLKIIQHTQNDIVENTLYCAYHNFLKFIKLKDKLENYPYCTEDKNFSAKEVTEFFNTKNSLDNLVNSLEFKEILLKNNHVKDFYDRLNQLTEILNNFGNPIGVGEITETFIQELMDKSDFGSVTGHLYKFIESKIGAKNNTISMQEKIEQYCKKYAVSEEYKKLLQKLCKIRNAYFHHDTKSDFIALTYEEKLLELKKISNCCFKVFTKQ